MDYTISCNNKEYKINESSDGSSVTINLDGKSLSPFDPYNKNNEKEYNENNAEFVKKQEEWAEASISYQVGTYLNRVLTTYLNWLTRIPAKNADATESITGLKYNDEVTREFELAYGLGMGEGKKTLRLKISKIEFNTTFNFDNSWAWGSPIAENADKKPDVSTTDVEVSNIKLELSYWRPNGGSKIINVNNPNEILNSNWESFWKNYRFNNQAIIPKNLTFNVETNNKLKFKVIPVAINKSKEEQPSPYYATGTVKIENLNNANFYSWPFYFENFTDTNEQKDINKLINDDLAKSYNDLNWIPNTKIKEKLKDFFNISNGKPL